MERVAGETNEMLRFRITQFVDEKPYIHRVSDCGLWENICTLGFFSVIGSNICNAPTPVQEFRAVSDNNTSILVYNRSLLYIEKEMP
jgi:hypothetical protein